MLVDRVAIDQMRVVMGFVKFNVIASWITACATLIIFRNELPLSFALPWFIAFVVVTALRLYYVSIIRKLDINEGNYKHFAIALTLLSTAGGSLWGVLGFYGISAETPLTNMILVMIFTGLVANAAATLSPLLPLFLGFAATVMLPVVYKFVTFGEFQFYGIAALMIFYLIVTLVNISGFRSSLRQSIELRYENIELIDGLKIQNSKTQVALEAAEQANLAKSRFFAAASHDLRQPLQSLSMFTATLATKLERVPDEKKIVSQIEKSIQSLEGLFNALLDISSLDAGTLKVRKQHFMLEPHVNQIVNEFLQQAQANSLYIEVDVVNDVVFTDPILLGRVLRNLIENAIHYTSSGGIKIRGRASDERLILSIADTGIGISNDNQAYVFGEFAQLNNPERDRNKGLGLGLSIVQRVCKLLDISITLESTIDVGTRFTLDLERGDASHITQQTALAAESSGVESLFILVIDDEEDVRLSLEGLLLAWGCAVMVSSSGEEAVRQIMEYGSNPDVIISDYRLRDSKTGGDAISIVRKHCKSELPAIVVTGDIDPSRLIEIDKLKLPVLHKPCSAESLRNLLLKVV